MTQYVGLKQVQCRFWCGWSVQSLWLSYNQRSVPLFSSKTNARQISLRFRKRGHFYGPFPFFLFPTTKNGMRLCAQTDFGRSIIGVRKKLSSVVENVPVSIFRNIFPPPVLRANNLMTRRLIFFLLSSSWGDRQAFSGHFPLLFPPNLPRFHFFSLE